MRLKEQSSNTMPAGQPGRLRRLGSALGLAAAVVTASAAPARAEIPTGWTDGSAVGYVTRGWEAANCPVPAALRPGLGDDGKPRAAATPAAVGSFENPSPFTRTAGPFTRKGVHQLTTTELQTLRRGFQLLQNMPSTDPRSMVQLAARHCIYCGETSLNATDKPPTSDIHAGRYRGLFFLPFHRAFMYYLERIMRSQLIADAKTTATKTDDAAAAAFALPYWEWATKRIHGIYLSGGGATALPDQRASRIVQLSSSAMSDLGRDWAVALAITDPNVFYSTTVSFSASHVTPHNDTQGWMRNPLHSARQPLFYGHHGNVDRLWADWTKAQGTRGKGLIPTGAAATTAWTTIRMVFPNEKGQYEGATASDVADTASLGYTYSAP